MNCLATTWKLDVINASQIHHWDAIIVETLVLGWISPESGTAAWEGHRGRFSRTVQSKVDTPTTNPLGLYYLLKNAIDPPTYGLLTWGEKGTKELHTALKQQVEKKKEKKRKKKRKKKKRKKGNKKRKKKKERRKKKKEKRKKKKKDKKKKKKKRKKREKETKRKKKRKKDCKKREK